MNTKTKPRGEWVRMERQYSHHQGRRFGTNESKNSYQISCSMRKTLNLYDAQSLNKAAELETVFRDGFQKRETLSSIVKLFTVRQ